MEPFPYHEALERAIALSRLCPPASPDASQGGPSAFSVGAIVFDGSGREVATGYSRETDALSHAEEIALAKAHIAKQDVRGGTIISSMEPCGERRSRTLSCADLILQAGIARVVYAFSEPPKFVEPTGAVKLKAAGVEVIHYPMR